MPIPGETNWVKNNFAEKSHQFRTHFRTNPISVGKKRPLDQEDESIEMECGETKRSCPSVEPTNPNSISGSGDMEKILNFPLPSTDSVGCILKMYTEDELPLNDVIEVVGIVSFNTPGVSMEGEEKEDFHPPSSIIPRIHCIVIHKWLHNNPLLPRFIGTKWDEGKCVTL